MPATSTRHSGWQFRQAGGHQGNSDISAVYEGTEVTRMTGSAYTVNLKTFIGASTNANVTLGLTIDQAANDDYALALKSSDIATGLVDDTVTGLALETDDYYTISKRHATNGGATVQVMALDAALSTVSLDYVVGGTGDTTKSASGRALKEIVFYEHNGSNARSAVTANGNVFGIRAYTGSVETKFLVDEDGDLFADGGTTTNAVTVYDDMPDAMLVRAFDKARSDAGVLGFVQGQWDDYTTANEQALVETGILGAPLAEGGLINVTRLQQLHNGAIWQLWSDVLDVAKALPAAAQEKLPARIKDRFLALSEG